MLFLWSGSFLLRLEHRQFLAGLFQLPPRITRRMPNGIEIQFLHDPEPKGAGVRVIRKLDQSQTPSLKLGITDFSTLPGSGQILQPPSKPTAGPPGQSDADVSIRRTGQAVAQKLRALVQTRN